MSKKVLIFSTAYLPLVGGAEIAVKEITQRLTDWRFDLIAAKIKPDLARFEKIGNVNIYRVGLGINFDKFLLPFLGLLKANQLERKNHYDLTWSIMASFGGFLGLFFKYFHSQKPWLLTLQEGDPIRAIFKKVGIFRPLFKQIFRRADYIQAISRYLADWAKEMGSRCPIEIVPNGVDPEYFSQEYPAAELNKLESEINKKEEDKYLITASRLVLKNAVDDVIKSLKYLPKNVKFLILGSGPDLAKLQKLAEELEVKNRVIFLGQIDHKEILKYLKISDIFIRPSLSEGLGNSFLEAMAAGLPVIGTSVGGIPDFLEDRKTGLFCRVRNPQNIAGKVKELLSDNELRRVIIDNGWALVEKKYSWFKISQQMDQIFKKLSEDA